jgi:peptidoglycan-associated lipoprotein
MIDLLRVGNFCNRIHPYSLTIVVNVFINHLNISILKCTPPVACGLLWSYYSKPYPLQQSLKLHILKEEMKMKTLNLLPVALVVTMLFVSGCSKTVMKNETAAGDDAQTASQAEPAVAEATQAPEPQPQLSKPDAREIFLNQLVYFDFDSAVLTLDAQSMLQRKVQWLKENPEVAALLIEGHCDERGTDAYNMALGERRAEAVKAYLLDLGLVIGNLETQSYGEEKPAVDGHSEEAWSKNRRTSFVIN